VTVNDVGRALPQTVLRAATDRRLLDETIRQGRTTRVELADATGYSRPTVSEAVRRLVEAGLLDATGLKETGRRGRVGTFYSLGARAGWVLALSIDQTGVRVRAADLAGRTLFETWRPPGLPGDVTDLVESVRAGVGAALAGAAALGAASPGLSSSDPASADPPSSGPASSGPASSGPPSSGPPSSGPPSSGPPSSGPAPVDPASSGPASAGAGADGPGPLRAVGVSIANPIDPVTHQIVPLAGTPFPEGVVSPAEMIGDLISAPLLVDNDVNLAALAEHRTGRAAGATSFAYVYVGGGLGVGLYIGDQLIRGAHGLAGEIGYLPGVLSPTIAGDLATSGLGRSDAPSNDVAAVLDLLDHSDDKALAALADAVGRAIISVAAVVDPDLVLLGGPVGTHPALLPRVREVIAGAFPGPTRVDHGTLGADAPLHGALELAIEHARSTATTPS
jgi:predicted NBD/HSP70 family sugar kinase/DNA-binding transcriptional ArsR family regulator